MTASSLKGQIPPLFAGARLDKVNPAQFEFIHEYRSNFKANLSAGRGLLISGPAGVGKSWAMAALTVEYMRRAVSPGSCHFETVPDVLEKYHELSGKQTLDGFRDQTWTKTYETVRWLVLNDMGKEYRGGKLAQQATANLGRLIRHRAERKLVTHITTNLTLGVNADGSEGENTFQEVYGESLTSLLSECTDAYLVWGADRRKRHTKRVDIGV